MTLTEGDTFNLIYKLDFEKDSFNMATETFQEFLQKNPDIRMTDAFFELFKFYPDATVKELEQIFKDEINTYIGIKPKKD